MHQPRLRPCAIFDLDGTLADCSHRVHHLDHSSYHANSAERWQAFWAGIPNDTLINPVARVLRSLNEVTSIVLCTGRSENNRAATEEWLAEHVIPYSRLIMRASDCFRPDHIVKSEMLDKLLAEGWRPWIVFDDRQSVVDMWRSRGLVCAQVAPGSF